MSNDADLLRRAADEIRFTARLAQREYDARDPGDWAAFDPGEASDEERHIALWSPDVALLVAQAFERDAQQLEFASGWILSCDEPGSIERSIELARAILSDPS